MRLVQQTATRGASLRERQLVRELQALHLHARAGGAPPTPTGPLPSSRSYAAGEAAGGDDATRTRGAAADEPSTARQPVDATAHEGLVNASASRGELSLVLRQPASRWLYLLVHGAAVATDAAIYDVLVEAADVLGDAPAGEPPSGAVLGGADEQDDRGLRAPTSEEAAERSGLLAERWRYTVDPEGPPSEHSEWVLARYVHPDS